MMRWWWFGPAVTPEGLDRELQAMHDAGLGGVEVQPVYPLVPDDRGRGLVNHPFLSPPFLDAVRHSAETARRLGLRFDLTLGSGWPYGGPHISVDHAAGRLRWEKVAVKARRVPLPAMTTGERLIAVTAPDGGAELTDIRGDAVWLPDGPLPAEVWVFIAGRTGMMVKRAAVGAEGYVLDHYDRAALQAHLDAVGTPLLDALRGMPPATVFCDSLEVFGSDWTPDLLPEFARRRGYDLRPHLAALVSGSDARGIALRQDWGRTLGELYEERFLAPLAEWTHARGSKLRIQGYGIPPATLSSNRLADLTDGEGAQWKTITPARWASSANHLFDRAVTASETWTWLHSPSFAATPLDLKAEADRHFLMGVNQLIGHGWPSTPAGVDNADWRFNWRFYAAGAFNDRNPWWIAMPDVVALPAAGERAAARGPAGQRRRALPADERRARRHQAGHGAPPRTGARAHRPGGAGRDPRRRLRLRRGRRWRARRAGIDSGERVGHRRAALPHGGAAGGAHDAGRDAGAAARVRGGGRARSSPPIGCRSARRACAASRSRPT